MIGIVQKYVGEAETEKALDSLLLFFQSDRKYTRLKRIARKTQALYYKTLQDETKGIISFDNAKLNYNTVNDMILRLLDDLEQGNLNPARYEVERDKTPGWQLIVSLLTLVVLAAGVGYWIFSASGRPAICPDFARTSLFNVLLTPFDDLAGSDLKPHVEIQRELIKRINRNQQLTGKSDVKVTYRKVSETNILTPPEAESLGLECLAQLVMWGTAENTAKGKIIEAEFKLVNQDQLKLTKLDILNGTTLIDTVETITSISGNGILVNNINMIIEAFFGLINHELGNHEAAIASLEPVTTSFEMGEQRDSSAFLAWNTVLADSYIATDNSEKAIETYDKVLEVHPNYTLALANRGLLQFKMQNYAASINDLTDYLAMKPTDVNVRTARAEAYMKTREYDKAQKDYEIIRKNKPEDPRVNNRWQELDREIKKQNRLKVEASSLLRNNANDLSALQLGAEAALSTGDHKKAEEYASRAIRLEPSNLQAWGILIEAQLEKGNQAAAEQTIQRAEQAGTSLNEICKVNPSLKAKINRPALRRLN